MHTLKVFIWNVIFLIKAALGMGNSRLSPKGWESELVRDVELIGIIEDLCITIYGTSSTSRAYRRMYKYIKEEYLDTEAELSAGNLIDSWIDSKDVLLWILNVDRVEIDSVLYPLIKDDALLAKYPALHEYVTKTLNSCSHSN